MANQGYKVTADDIQLINSVISDFKWLKGERNKQNLQKRLISLFRETKPANRCLIISLIKKIEHITLESYPEHCETIVDKFSSMVDDSFDTIYLLPIITEKDEKKVKSGHSVAYFMESMFDCIFNHKFCRKIKILNACSSIEFENDKKILVIFCDNFIGTGKQALDCLNWYKRIKEEKNTSVQDTILIISIVILQEGLDALRNHHHNIFFSILHKKGISDDPVLMKANALSVMNDIEKEIGVTKTWNLGYRQSEALLAFDFKAPNNTFPIFWLTKQNRNTIFFR